MYHIELEMQNEELKRTRTEAEDALCKYTDLYDFAPVGYFTFDRHGTILEVNLTGAALLDIERCNLINKRFQLFVKPDCIPVFNTFCNKVLENNTKQTCEVELMKNDKSSVYVRLEGIAIENRKGKEKQTMPNGDYRHHRTETGRGKNPSLANTIDGNLYGRKSPVYA